MNSTPISFDQLLNNIITQIINPIIILLASAAFVLFLYEAYQLIRSGGSDTERADAQRGILGSFIGLIIIFGVYGILNIATSTFNLPKVTPITNISITAPAKPKTFFQKLESKFTGIFSNSKSTMSISSKSTSQNTTTSSSKSSSSSIFSKVGSYLKGLF